MWKKVVRTETLVGITSFFVGILQFVSRYVCREPMALQPLFPLIASSIAAGITVYVFLRILVEYWPPREEQRPVVNIQNQTVYVNVPERWRDLPDKNALEEEIEKITVKTVS